ncbi:MAG: hypothetical protein WC785_04330 [Tatlockia sp.]|jgi:hypothetical protein
MSYWDAANEQILQHNYKLFVLYYTEWKNTPYVNTYSQYALLANIHNALCNGKNGKSKENGKISHDLKKIIHYLIQEGADAQVALNQVANTDDVAFVKELLSMENTNAQDALDFLQDRRGVRFFTRKGTAELYLKSIVLDQQSAGIQEDEASKRRHCILS